MIGLVNVPFHHYGPAACRSTFCSTTTVCSKGRRDGDPRPVEDGGWASAVPQDRDAGETRINTNTKSRVYDEACTALRA
jgi:hypothetical protein